jgi:hypothetical protein
MKQQTFNQCTSIIKKVGKDAILKLYESTRKRGITIATLKMAIEKEEINELMKKKKSVSNVVNEIEGSKGKVYRALKK